MRHDFIGIALQLGVLGSLGFSLNTLTMDEIKVTTPDYPKGTGERAGSYDLAIGASYARALNDRLNIGGTVKYIRSQLWHMSAHTMAVDLGVTFSNVFDFFRLGASISNMGGKMRVEEGGVHYPGPEEGSYMYLILGDVSTEYDSETRILKVAVMTSHYKIVNPTGELNGRIEDYFEGPITEDGQTWNAEWRSYNFLENAAEPPIEEISKNPVSLVFHYLEIEAKPKKQQDQ